MLDGESVRFLHSEQVHAVVLGDEPQPAMEEVAPSWIRSANELGVDPAATDAPRVLSTHELRELREPLAEWFGKAHEEIDGLYRVVRNAGYVVLLTDPGGTAVEHRGDESQQEAFKYWGTWLGGVWSENAEGTNGIGTCIAERRPITVHRSQHFKSRHSELSCSGAPIFCPNGDLLAVIDVSAIDPSLSEHAHALTGPLTIGCARDIEERFFREEFRDHWILAVDRQNGDGSAMLLAVDRDGRLVGADRAARENLAIGEADLAAGANLWRYFNRDPSIFRAVDEADIAAGLSMAEGDGVVSIVVTPPLARAITPTLATFHTRPRRPAFHVPEQNGSGACSRGGLPSGTIRRIRDYVKDRLAEPVELKDLAGVAGLSVFHFARQFKESFGVTPHAYLVHRRIERAGELLANTELSVANIALATGFADQGHFARAFRRVTGTTPRAWRRARH